MKRLIVSEYIIPVLLLLYILCNPDSPAMVRRVASPADFGMAIKQAGGGDTLLIQEGIYSVINLIIDKPITLLARGKVVFNAAGPGDVLIIRHGAVTVDGLTIRGTNPSFMKDYAAIKIEVSDNVTIKNCILENNFFGIYLSNAAHAILSNNRITGSGKRESNSGNGIHLWNSRENLVENNTVSGHRDGIYLEFTKQTNIRNNKSTNNLRYGLHFMFSDSCHYTGNSFTGNGAGVAVMYSSLIQMKKNTFSLNNGTTSYGLLLKDIKQSTITDNFFTGNTVGVYIEASSRITFSGNVLRENGTALKIMANSEGNRFLQNSFLNNSFDVASNSRQNFNEYRNNYWDTYSGYDLNKDGIGDVPHHPVRLSSIITAKYPASIILLRGLFIKMIDLTEKIFPAMTPSHLADSTPVMQIKHDNH